MDEYRFQCKRCKNRFEVSSPTPARNLHVLLALITLGGWFVIRAFVQLFSLFRMSQCPDCGRRSRAILSILIFLMLGTAEVSWLIYYFVEYAPETIVANASLAELPEDLALDQPIEDEQYNAVLSYILLVGILPIFDYI